MSTSNHSLNLARKKRPKLFSDMVGQDVSLRMLQNSLYLKKFFPLYIFSGQRGCGKTTSARIFAAAINCEALASFQIDPKKFSLPCLECSSCKELAAGTHPDFVEIDAASHTGVDNVRQILESAVHLPVSGGKKLYLIDEAHMLSKAAFNAFLKMLEEPPASVLFMLATTELHKIPDTVRSRAFHIFFGPISTLQLANYLKEVCNQEQIEAHEDALMLIAREAQGSARDAVNLLDQAHLVGSPVTRETMQSFLGQTNETILLTIFSHTAEGKTNLLLEFLHTHNVEAGVPQRLWDGLVQLCRTLVWTSYGVKQADSFFALYEDQLALLVQKISRQRLIEIFNTLWESEELFLRTSQKYAFLESVLISLSEEASLPISVRQKTLAAQPLPPTPALHEAIAEKKEPLSQSTPSSEWNNFLASLEQGNDPLLNTILKQARYLRVDHEAKAVVASLKSQSPFFLDKITASHELIVSALRQSFPGIEALVIEKARAHESNEEKKIPSSGNAIDELIAFAPQQAYQNHPKQAQAISSKPFIKNSPGGSGIDISNAEKWPKATLLASHFSGKLEKSE